MRLRRRRAFLSELAAIGVLAPAAACSATLGTVSNGRAARLIAYFSGNTTRGAEETQTKLRRMLLELGYVDGRDIVFEQWVAENDASRLPAMAAEIAARKPALIMIEATNAALEAKRATTTIPIVFWQVTAPVESGLVANLAHPGGNITGVSTHTSELSGKRLEWLREAVPDLKRIAMLWNGNFPSPLQGGRQNTIAAAASLGLTLDSYPIHDARELERTMTALIPRPDAVLVLAGFSSVSPDRSVVPEAAAAIRLPQMFSDAAFAQAGGLMAIGPNYETTLRRAAEFIDRIFKGTPPGDIPIELPTTFDRVINLQMAARLGLRIPESLIRQATEIIQ